MKPEVSERLLIEELFNKTVEEKKVNCSELLNVDRLTGDASTRRYYRVYCKENSYVVCLDHPSADSENTFVTTQQFFNNQNVRVPKIFDYEPSKGYILEEDLGDRTLLKELAVIETVEQEYEVYKKALKGLAGIQRSDVNEKYGQTIRPLMFDFEKLINEVDFTVDYFVDKFLKVSDESLKRTLVEEFYSICQRLSEKEMVCTHRDFHSRNIMCKEDEFIIIDFQDARLGIPQYDLVSLLEDCYYQVDSRNVDKLKKYYFENVCKEIVSDQRSYEEFLLLYDDMLLQRVFKAIGSFSYIYERRKDARYLKYIGFGMEKIKTVLMKNQNYKDLKKNLFGIYYES